MSAQQSLATALAWPANESRVPQGIKADVLGELTALRLLHERMSGTLSKIEALEPRSADGRRLAISLGDVTQALEGAAKQLWSELRGVR